MANNIIISSLLHLFLIIITALSLPFLAKKPIDLPPIISIELIQITDKTSIPYAPKAKKIIEEIKKKEKEKLVSEQAPLTLSINSKGEIFIQESKVEFDYVIAKILAVSKNRTDTRIYVRGDKTINYGRVLEVMGMLSGSGFKKVALISEPYKER